MEIYGICGDNRLAARSVNSDLSSLVMSPRPVLVLNLVAALAVACGIGGASESVQSPAPASTTAPVNLPDADIDEDAGTATDAPSYGQAAARFGSPLCNASTWMGCYPDDPNYPGGPATAKSCALAPDGGMYDPVGGYDNATLACHVARAVNAAGVQPVCTPVGAGADGVACGRSTDCAAGYECIGNHTCQHYCCAGSCTTQDKFCDIQPTAIDPGLKVPVCMPIRSCGLLDQPTDAGSCPRSQTCAVVRENGATSCVAVGQRQVGDECDTDHCGRNLTCVGTSGHRRCYMLCHTMVKNGECPSTRQTCVGGLPLFPVPGIGICQ